MSNDSNSEEVRVPLGEPSPDHGFDGTYIQIEGPDGAGKTEVIDYIDARDDMDEVLTTREPNHPTVRQLLFSEDLGSPSDLHLFIADRIAHLEGFVLPRLSEGRTVVSDRGVLSTMVYQAVEFENEGRDTEYVRDMALRTTIAPDLVIRLDISPETSKERIEDPNRFERDGYLEAVNEMYRSFENTMDLTTVNGERPPEEVGEEVCSIIKTAESEL